MPNVLKFSPNSIITLFDRNKDSKIQGVLSFVQELKSISPPQISPSLKINLPEPKPRPKASLGASLWLEEKYKPSKFNLLGFKTLAVICFIISIFGFTNLILPVAIAEAKLRLAYLENSSPFNLDIAPIPQPTPAPTPDVVSAFTVDPKKDTPLPQDFRISIPKINLQSDIVANVDPSQEKVYRTSLKAGVAHAKGSYFPGEKGSVFLFAHSTDIPERIAEYNALFYGVKDLQPGDQIVILFRGKTYVYTVENKITTSPFDLETIRKSNADLILQTCWPPGTDWQRLMVTAKLI